MSKPNSPIAIGGDDTGAEHTVKKFQKAGSDIKKLSLVGKTRQQEHAFNVTQKLGRLR